MKQGGYSLIELMVVVTIVGIIAAAGVPHYTRAVEQARCDQAIETLRSVWSAQRMHRLEHGTYATSLSELDAAGLLDKNMDRKGAPFRYEMKAASDEFVVVATRQNSGWSGSFLMNQAGKIDGVVRDTGGNRVTP